MQELFAATRSEDLTSLPPSMQKLVQTTATVLSHLSIAQANMRAVVSQRDSTLGTVLTELEILQRRDQNKVLLVGPMDEAQWPAGKRQQYIGALLSAIQAPTGTVPSYNIPSSGILARTVHIFFPTAGAAQGALKRIRDLNKSNPSSVSSTLQEGQRLNFYLLDSHLSRMKSMPFKTILALIAHTIGDQSFSQLRKDWRTHTIYGDNRPWLAVQFSANRPEATIVCNSAPCCFLTNNARVSLVVQN